MRSYNAGVTPRSPLFLLLAIVILGCASSACNRAPENKDAVRAGVMEHLGKNTGLDLQSMDVELGNVNFEGDKATATVSFKPKASPNAGMSMNYTLQREGAKWVVQRAGGGGHDGGGMGSEKAPPDPGAHAPGATAPPTPGGRPGDLPAGHPPVAPGSGANAGGANQLPPGHPPVSGQPQPSQPKAK